MDEMLIRKAQGGDPEAFEMLMAGLEGLVWRVCWHYTGNRESASDCGQETMIRIWRRLGDFRGECAFESWVYRIAANCCLDWLRKTGRRKEDSLEALGERGVDPADPSPGTEEEALRRDEHARLRSAIAGLPEDQRDALVLTQLEGKSYGETAAMLSVSEGTVKSRVSRARERLREIFAREEQKAPENVQPDGRTEKERRERKRKGGGAP